MVWWSSTRPFVISPRESLSGRQWRPRPTWASISGYLSATPSPNTSDPAPPPWPNGLAESLHQHPHWRRYYHGTKPLPRELVRQESPDNRLRGFRSIPGPVQPDPVGTAPLPDRFVVRWNQILALSRNWNPDTPKQLKMLLLHVLYSIRIAYVNQSIYNSIRMKSIATIFKKMYFKYDMLIITFVYIHFPIQIDPSRHLRCLRKQ